MSLITNPVRSSGSFIGRLGVVSFAAGSSEVLYTQNLVFNTWNNTSEVSSNGTTTTILKSGLYRTTLKFFMHSTHLGSTANPHQRDIRLRVNGGAFDPAVFYQNYTGTTNTGSYNNFSVSQMVNSQTLPVVIFGALPQYDTNGILPVNCLFFFDSTLTLSSGDAITLPYSWRQAAAGNPSVFANLELSLEMV